MPEVSVIVPAYNHARYLTQRIDSILNQTFTDFELIILDDCSTDNSRDIINTYRTHPQVAHICFNDTNSGSPFAQWQKGIALAKGKWLWIAESDDYADPLFLETLLNISGTENSSDIIYSGSHWVNDKGEIGKDLSSYTTGFTKSGINEIREKLWYVCTIQNVSSCIIRRNRAAECIRGLTHYRACGDWMFYIKMLHHGTLTFTDAKLNYFRYYHDNTSNYAEKNKIWITEGINVLKYLPYKYFGIKNAARIFLFWHRRAKTLNASQKHKTRGVLLRAILNYIPANLT